MKGDINALGLIVDAFFPPCHYQISHGFLIADVFLPSKYGSGLVVHQS
jgi:hypothetical protein